MTLGDGSAPSQNSGLTPRPTIISQALWEMSETLLICAQHRGKTKARARLRGTEDVACKPLTSFQQIHASIVGRSLLRSFNNTLLLTRVLGCLKSVMQNRELELRQQRLAASAASLVESWARCRILGDLALALQCCFAAWARTARRRQAAEGLRRRCVAAAASREGEARVALLFRSWRAAVRESKMQRLA